MKLSAFYKQQGANVEWHNPEHHYDVVHMSKVFSFTDDYLLPISSEQIYKGGTGFCIDLVDGKEIYHSEKDRQLPSEIEHLYPDYSIYPDLTADSAYGFMSRGCPRGCDFCHVGMKEGKRAYKVANLDEFWDGQKILFCWIRT